jgi:hypothetical protein
LESDNGGDEVFGQGFGAAELEDLLMEVSGTMLHA